MFRQIYSNPKASLNSLYLLKFDRNSEISSNSQYDFGNYCLFNLGQITFFSLYICKEFSETSFWECKLVNYVNRTKSILIKGRPTNRPTNQNRILCRLVYHIFWYFVLILYFVSSVDTNISNFILLHLNCNNGNSFLRVLHNSYASYCYAAECRNRNFQYTNKQSLQILCAQVSCCVLFRFTFLLLTLFVCGDVHLNPGPKRNRSYYNFSIFHWNPDNVTAHNYGKRNLLEAYNAVNKFDMTCIS